MLAGSSYLLRGFGMWRRRPGLMVLGMLPALLVFAVLVTLLVLLLLNLGDLASWLTPFADDWDETARGLLRLGLAVVLIVAAVALSALSFTGLTLIVGEPFYERIWRETEGMLGGPVPDRSLGWWHSAGDAVAFAGISVICGAGLLLVGFLPIVGPILGAALGLVVSGRLLAAELVSRPLEARGLDRAARRELLRRHQGGMLGFGVATQACFLVPLGAIVVMPAAVVGSTTLARELLADPSQTLAETR